MKSVFKLVVLAVSMSPTLPQPGGALLGTRVPDDMHGQVRQIVVSRTGTAYVLYDPFMMANLDVLYIRCTAQGTGYGMLCPGITADA